MTRPTGRPRGRPPLPPAPGAHRWETVTADDGRERHRCALCGARAGAWLTEEERRRYTLVVRAHLRDDEMVVPPRADHRHPCYGAASHTTAVVEGRALWVLPTGGSTRDRDRAAAAWRRLLDGGRTVGRPRARETVPVSMRLGAEVVAWLRAQSAGVTATVERLCREAMEVQPLVKRPGWNLGAVSHGDGSTGAAVVREVQSGGAACNAAVIH